MKRDRRKCGKCGNETLALGRVYFGSLTTRDYACSSCAHKESVGTWGNVALLLGIPLVAYPALYVLNGPPPSGAYFVGVAAVAWAVWQIRAITVFNKLHGPSISSS